MRNQSIQNHLGNDLHQQLTKISIGNLLNSWHDCMYLGFYDLFEMLPSMINEKINVQNLVKKIEKNEKIQMNMNDGEDEIIDVNDLFIEIKQNLILKRGKDRDQIYFKNAKLKSKSSENIAKTMTDLLNSIKSELNNLIEASNKDQASKESAAIRKAFGLRKIGVNVRDFYNIYCSAHILDDVGEQCHEKISEAVKNEIDTKSTTKPTYLDQNVTKFLAPRSNQNATYLMQRYKNIKDE